MTSDKNIHILWKISGFNNFVSKNLWMWKKYSPRVMIRLIFISVFMGSNKMDQFFFHIDIKSNNKIELKNRNQFSKTMTALNVYYKYAIVDALFGILCYVNDRMEICVSLNLKKKYVFLKPCNWVNWRTQILHKSNANSQ